MEITRARAWMGAAAMLAIGLVGLIGGCATAQGGSAGEKRASALQMRDDAVAQLLRERPEVKERMDKAVGYGAFSNIGTNIIFVSTGGGYGVVTDKSGGDTFMKMGEVGVGLGLGVKDFRAVFLFYDRAAMERFVTRGWEFGGEADAAAVSGDQGGQAAAAGNVHKGIEVYQITQAGIILGANVSGTKYWRDSDLN